MKLKDDVCSFCGKIIPEKDSLWVTDTETICENCHIFVIKNKNFQKEVKQIISAKRKGDKYVIVDMVIDGSRHGAGIDQRVQYAFTPEGDLIGDIKMTKLLINTKGIKPELRLPIDSICSIGYSKKKEMYFGWTYGKLRGFIIGSKLEEGDILTEVFPAGSVAQTLEDTKMWAIKFVELVAAEYEERRRRENHA